MNSSCIGTYDAAGNMTSIPKPADLTDCGIPGTRADIDTLGKIREIPHPLGSATVVEAACGQSLNNE